MSFWPPRNAFKTKIQVIRDTLVSTKNKQTEKNENKDNVIEESMLF